MVTAQGKQGMCVLWLFETKSVFKTQCWVRSQNEKIHFHRMLSNIGYSNFKRLVVFCTEKEQEDVDRIQEAFSRSSQSTRLASLQLGIPKTIVWRVVHNSLHLNTYRVQTVQAFKPGNKLGRRI
jgi:hypothetical protein